MNYEPLEEKSLANINNNTLERKHVPKALGIWLVALIIASAFWFIKSNYFSIHDEQYFCTMEAKLCPDGSAVGRTGPKCEFAACPDISDTSGWKTYRNEELGYLINYPSSYFLKIGEKADCFSATEGDSDATMFCVQFHNNLEKITPREWSKKKVANGYIEKPQITIAGEQALRFDSLPNEFPDSLVILAHENWIVEISGNYNDDLLSTFKFIEPISDINVSEWKTYRNEEYGFEVEYPADWNLRITEGGININKFKEDDVLNILIKPIWGYRGLTLEEIYNGKNERKIDFSKECKDVSINNFNALDCAPAISIGGERLIIFQKDDMFFEVVVIPEVDISNQIVSTFRFIN